MPSSRPPGRSARVSGGEHAPRLEADVAAQPERLARQHQVEIRPGRALPRDDGVEQEAAVLAVEHQGGRRLGHHAAGLGAFARPPVLGEEGLQLEDLALELGGGRSLERHFLPHVALRSLLRRRRQPGRLGIGDVGHRHHHLGMLEEAVGHLVERQAHVLEADLLAGDVEGEALVALVHRAQHAGEHGAVAHAGIEEAHRRRARLDQLELARDAVRHHPLLRAGVDEHQIFLAVVVEAEILLRGRAFGLRRPGGKPGRFACVLRLNHARHPAFASLPRGLRARL